MHRHPQKQGSDERGREGRREKKRSPKEQARERKR